MRQQAIKSQDLTIEKLFDDFYLIPDFQREYVWQEKQVEQLLKDVLAEFPRPDSNSQPDEYFIGSIIVSLGGDGSDRLYDIIDGQQRITTAYILLCTVKNYILGIDNQASVGALNNIISTTFTNSFGVDTPRYRVTLQYEDSSKILEAIAKNNVNLDAIPQKTDSAKNIINAYHTIEVFLRNEFGEELSEVRRFYAHFIKNVKLVRVETLNVASALRVFETINDRGIGLDPMDLLKNLMFRKAGKDNFEILKDKWKELTNCLQSAKEKPLTFLRYFIFSQYDVERDDVQSKTYEWFLNNEPLCGYKDKPIEFVDNLRLAAQAYAHFIEGKNKDGTNNRYLKNITYFTSTTRQHMSLLLAALNLPDECFTELCRHLENLLFVFIITAQKTNEFERVFIQWAGDLRQVRNLQDLEQFIITTIQPVKQNLFQRFESSFLVLKERDLQQAKLRYTLAKLTQFINENALGSEAPWVDLDTYINKQVEIEHILPQTPNKAVVDAFDKQGDINKYIRFLGNLTLLEKSINASIGRGLFSEKKIAYKQSNFFLTKSLAEKPVVGTDTAINRAVQELKEFENWNSQDIEERQRMLTQLAKKVWDMEEVVRENAVEADNAESLSETTMTSEETLEVES